MSARPSPWELLGGSNGGWGEESGHRFIGSSGHWKTGSSTTEVPEVRRGERQARVAADHGTLDYRHLKNSSPCSSVSSVVKRNCIPASATGTAECPQPTTFNTGGERVYESCLELLSKVAKFPGRNTGTTKVNGGGARWKAPGRRKRRGH